MKKALILLLFLPTLVFASTGLGSLSVINDFFYVLGIVIYIILIKKSYGLKKQYPQRNDKKNYLIPISIIVLLEGVSFYFMLPSSARMYWLCLLHICLFVLTIFRYVDNPLMRTKIKIGALLFGLLLVLVPPKFVNLTKFVPIENNPLRDSVKITETYKNNVIEVENKYYQLGLIYPALSQNEDVLIKGVGTGKFHIFRKEKYWMWERWEQRSEFGFMKGGYYLSIPIIKKHHDLYHKVNSRVALVPFTGDPLNLIKK